MNNQLPYQVGVTGGIGSGKSMVCKLFSYFGWPCYDADQAAKDIVNADSHVKSQLIDLLGPQAYVDGKYNRPWVAGQVFKNEELLQKINQAVHPAVGRHYQSWMLRQASPIVVKEAALLIEAGTYQAIDFLILVTASEAVKINRVLNRDPGRKPGQVKDIMSRQLTDIQKRPYVDHELINDGGTLLLPQVINVVGLIKNKVMALSK